MSVLILPVAFYLGGEWHFCLKFKQTSAQIKYHKTQILRKQWLDKLNVLITATKYYYFRVKKGKKYQFWYSGRQKLFNSSSSMVQRTVELEWELFTWTLTFKVIGVLGRSRQRTWLLLWQVLTSRCWRLGSLHSSARQFMKSWLKAPIETEPSVALTFKGLY